MLGRSFVVARREYFEHVRTKAFWLSTLLVPIFMTAMMVIPAWLASRGGGTVKVAVLDLTGRYFSGLEEKVDTRLSAPTEKLKIELFEQDPGVDPERTREELKRRVHAREFDGILILPESLPGSGAPQYVAPNVAAFRLLSVLDSVVNEILIEDRLSGAGLDPEKVGKLTKRVDLETFKLGAEGEETQDQGQVFLLSYGLVMIIFMSVLGYGIYVMRGVLEEKSSHIVEIIISAVRPFELMLGKILGIGAVGLTQFMLWSLVALAVTSPGVAAAAGLGAIEMPSMPVSLMVFFVVFFVLGFLLYGTLYAGIGAAFNTEKDAQNFQSVITLFLVAPLMLMMVIFNEPNGTLAISLSFVPFFTPMLMFLRMTLVRVPPVQIGASVLLLVLSILAMAWIVGKIYRVGILMQGSKPGFKDILNWIRQA